MLSIKVGVLTVMFFAASISGGNIVDELRRRFNDVTNECVDAQNNTQPAYKCAGLLIRGVELRKGMKFAWSLKSIDKEQNALSYAFLRRNHTFEYLGTGYDAGFILYPHLKTPPHKLQPKVLCTFPYNSNTVQRSDRGCGRNAADKTGSSEPCHTQNITTASEWLEHFELTNWANILLCGFKTIKHRETEDFATAIQANILLLQNDIIAKFSNELRIEGWHEDNAKSIPIEAFFYFIGTKNGYQNAVKFRDDFRAQSGGEIVPIVGIKLPTDNDPNVHIIGDEDSN